MFQESGDHLLKLFKTLNIETGKLNPSVIKAWFDTDCEYLLKWMCSSITEDNYVSVQENNEFSALKNKLTGDELDKELKIIEEEFPELFHYDLNLLEIDIAEDTIEVLEEQLESYENQIRINQQLDHNLSVELSKLTSEEMKSHIEKESVQETCQKLADTLDQINGKSYDQIVKYHTYLSNYELATDPEFINNMEVTELEEQFTDILTWVNSTIKLDNGLLNTSIENNFSNVLSDIKNYISQSFVKCLAVQMESEALNKCLNFLDKYDCNTHSSFMEGDSLEVNIEYNKSQQHYMWKVIEESSLKQAEYYVSQPTIRCLKNELNFSKNNLNYLNEIEKSILKILSHLVVMYDLYLEEKIDISSFNDFFKNVMQYVQKDLQNSNFRREAMMEIIDTYRDFSTKPIEHKFRLIGNFGTLLCRENQQSFEKILGEIKSTRNEIKLLETRCFNRKFEIPKNLKNNRDILQNFLTCGPTHRIVTISHDLQTLFYDINSNLNAQNTSVKSIMQIVQKAKDSFTENQWMNQRRLLWIYFITDSAKMRSLLEELENKTKHT